MWFVVVFMTFSLLKPLRYFQYLPNFEVENFSSVAERIANHYSVWELFCHWNFEMIHFIQLERPMPFCPGTPHCTIKGSAKHVRLSLFFSHSSWLAEGKTSRYERKHFSLQLGTIPTADRDYPSRESTLQHLFLCIP